MNTRDQCRFLFGPLCFLYSRILLVSRGSSRLIGKGGGPRIAIIHMQRRRVAVTQTLFHFVISLVK
uniref:Uncharacterized protein n=1 Tax=Daphnia magna TaxID=35525 RepID=A0A0P5CPN6_9CRUS